MHGDNAYQTQLHTKELETVWFFVDVNTAHTVAVTMAHRFAQAVNMVRMREALSEALVQQIPQKGIEVEGVSQNGSFDEALAQAIQTAKEKLRTDFVRWELLKTSGENGGFILKNELRVQISAMGPVSSIEGITRK